MAPSGSSRPTYVFENGKAYAFLGNEVIASADSIEELQRVAAEAAVEEDAEPRVTTGGYIVTPSGLKGRILGSTSDLWGREEITVRMENGHIAHLRLGEFKQAAAETSTEPSPVDALRARLATPFETSQDALKARITELRVIRREASAAVSTASETDAAALHSIVVAAEYETREAVDVLAHLESEGYESFVPTAPFESHVVEQATMGATANWLDGVAEDMIKEAEATDFQKLLDEGPEAFVAELDNAPLADQGMTHQMASSYVRTRTAGVADEAMRDRYEDMFLSRVEEARRAELAGRKTTIAKEAAAEHDEFASLPDDVLFS